MSGQEKTILLRKILPNARLPTVDKNGRVSFYVAHIDTESSYIRTGWVVDDHNGLIDLEFNILDINRLILKSNYEIACMVGSSIYKPGDHILTARLANGYKRLVTYGE